MSTTAGVGPQDYVAINGFAIAAALFGLVTLLALLGTPFLVAGAGAVICGGIALWQIRNSNGTQGGLSFAWSGIVLAIAVSIAWVTITRAEAAAQRPDREAVATGISEFGAHIAAGRYEQAYALLDTPFQQAWPLPEFAQHLERQQGFATRGRVTGIRWNEQVRFVTEGPDRFAQTMAIVNWSNTTGESRLMIALRQTPDGWRISFFEMFIVAQEEM